MITIIMTLERARARGHMISAGTGDVSAGSCAIEFHELDRECTCSRYITSQTLFAHAGRARAARVGHAIIEFDS